SKTFLNDGTEPLIYFTKDAAYGSTRRLEFRRVLFRSNDGAVEATAGTLSLAGGDTGSTEGTLNGAGANGLVRFESNFTLKTGVKIGRASCRERGKLAVAGGVSENKSARFRQVGGSVAV